MDTRKMNCPACNALKSVQKSRKAFNHIGCKFDLTILADNKKPTTFLDVCHLYIGARIVFENGEIKEFNNHRYYDFTMGIKVFKPTLRKQFSMTKEEQDECLKISLDEFVGNLYNKNQANNNAKSVAYLLGKGFDLFDLIPNGEAIDASPLW